MVEGNHLVVDNRYFLLNADYGINDMYNLYKIHEKKLVKISVLSFYNESNVKIIPQHIGYRGSKLVMLDEFSLYIFDLKNI